MRERAPSPVLVVDDDPLFCRALGRALTDRACRPVVAADLAEARQRLAEEPELALAIVDFNLPGASGLEVIRELRARRRMLPCVLGMACQLHRRLRDRQSASRAAKLKVTFYNEQSRFG